MDAHPLSPITPRPPPPQAGLAEVLRYHDGQPLVQGIWRQLAAQLAVCTDCVNVRGLSWQWPAMECGGQAASG